MTWTWDSLAYNRLLEVGYLMMPLTEKNDGSFHSYKEEEGNRSVR